MRGEEGAARVSDGAYDIAKGTAAQQTAGCGAAAVAGATARDRRRQGRTSGTAGLARFLVSGYSRVPAPPPRMMPNTFWWLPRQCRAASARPWGRPRKSGSPRHRGRVIPLRACTSTGNGAATAAAAAEGTSVFAPAGGAATANTEWVSKPACARPEQRPRADGLAACAAEAACVRTGVAQRVAATVRGGRTA